MSKKFWIIVSIILLVCGFLVVRYLLNRNSTDIDLEDYIKVLRDNYNISNNINYKFNGLPIYYINLDRSRDRYEKMEEQIKFYGIENIHRISAVDANNLKDIGQGSITFGTNTFKYFNTAVTCPYEGHNYRMSELACTLSHIKTIYTAYNRGDNRAIVIEDDLGFGLVPFWSGDVNSILDRAPQDWEIVSLWATRRMCRETAKKSDYLPYPEFKCWGTPCYVISRQGMEKVLRNIKENVINLHHELPADLFIYAQAKTYTYIKEPLFYLVSVLSTINDKNRFEHENMLNNIQEYFVNPEKKILRTCWPNNTPIPKIIHQTWKSIYLPNQFKSWSDEIKRVHPDWEHRLWTDEMNREFIKSHYPWFLPTYDGYDVNIKRVDAVRYFLLYHFGGVYVDMDMVTLKKLDGLCVDGKAIFGYQLRDKYKDGAIANAIMIAPPKHPLFEIIIHALDQTKDNYVLDSTGPGFLTEHIRKYIYKDLIIHPIPIIYDRQWDDKLANDNILKKDFELCRKRFPRSYFISFWTATWHEESPTLDYTIPKYFKHTKDSPPSRIPKKIFKILITDDDSALQSVPDYLWECVYSFVRLNPEYDLTILDKYDCENFLTQHFPSALQAYHTLKPYAYKSDLVRLCLLYVYGGVYSDFRQTLLRPLSEIINDDRTLICPRDLVIGKNKTPVYNSFIVSVPGNEIILDAINTIINNVNKRWYGENPLDITGPNIVGNAVNKRLKVDRLYPDVYKIGNDIIEILDYDKYDISKDDGPIIRPKPKGDKFKEDFKGGNNYWEMWHDRNVY